MFKKERERERDKDIPGKGDSKRKVGEAGTKIWCMHFSIGRAQNTKVKLECVRGWVVEGFMCHVQIVWTINKEEPLKVSRKMTWSELHTSRSF